MSTKQNTTHIKVYKDELATATYAPELVTLAVNIEFF